MENIENFIDRSIDRYVEFIESNEGDMPSTFNDLDKLIRGFRPGQLTVVSGIPGVGKTAFVLSMLYGMGSKKYTRIEYISSESKTDQIADRLIQIALNKDLKEIKRMTAQDFRDLCKLKLKFGLFPLDISSSLQPLKSYEGIKDRIIKLATIDLVECVCIDSLQSLWLKDRNFLPNNKNALGEIVNDLKKLASDLNIHIILVSNMTDPEIYSDYYQGRYFTKWMDQSGDDNACSQFSDVFILLDRPEVYDIFEDAMGNDLRGYIKVNVVKNRNGETGKVNLRFQSGRVTEIPDTFRSSALTFNDLINTDEPF